jgi:hypothetical protein
VIRPHQNRIKRKGKKNNRHEENCSLLRGKGGQSAVILVLDKFMTLAYVERDMLLDNTKYHTILGGCASLTQASARIIRCGQHHDTHVSSLECFVQRLLLGDLWQMTGQLQTTSFKKYGVVKLT